MYCVARIDEHACCRQIEDPIGKSLYDGAKHPGDHSDHECHCGFAWQNTRYQDGTRPQYTHLMREGDWEFSIRLWSTLLDGAVFQLWGWKRGLHVPFRWLLWWKR